MNTSWPIVVWPVFARLNVLDIRIIAYFDKTLSRIPRYTRVFREYHNFNLEDKDKLNRAAFKALKPGGKYVIVDHSRRHMQPETRELGRREDPVKVILEVQAAGFVLEDSSDMFYRPDDELRYEVGRKSVRGNTDRFSVMMLSQPLTAVNVSVYVPGCVRNWPLKS